MIGLLTWRFEPAERTVAEISCLVVASGQRRRGIGRELLHAGAAALRTEGVARVWLVTTNDNLGARRLYEAAGFRLTAMRPGAVDESRRTLKPSIAEIGQHGIPIHDELELERDLGAG